MMILDSLEIKAENMPLWPHQEKAIREIEDAWGCGIKSICCQLPTGSGKTRIIRHIVDNLLAEKHTIYIVAHRYRLVKQLSEEIAQAGIKHGIIQSGWPYLRYRVQVCSIATLINRVDKIRQPDTIIIDEFHHATNASYKEILSKWPYAKILGMTATPERLDGAPLSDIAEILIHGPQLRDLILQGYLVDFDYFAPSSVDMKGVKKTGGEYSSKESGRRVDKKTITGCAVEHYLRIAKGLPAIACCVSIRHAEHVAEEFLAAGVKAVAVHSKMDRSFVSDAIDGLKNGSVEVLCQVDLLGEGVDIKGASVLIWLRPTASLIVFLQGCGRVLRINKGKKKAIFLDHVANWARHGLPDDVRVWSLEGKRIKKKDLPTLKRCPGCMRPVTISSRLCSFCGYQWTETENKGYRIPKTKDGILINVKESFDFKNYRDLEKYERNRLVLEIAKCYSYKSAIACAAGFGVKAGGAWYIWTKVLKNNIHKSLVRVDTGNEKYTRRSNEDEMYRGNGMEGASLYLEE